MFRLLHGHHQAFSLNQFIKTLGTLLVSQLMFILNWGPNNARSVLMT